MSSDLNKPASSYTGHTWPQSNAKESLKGVKLDDGKVRLELLSTIWLNGVGRVLTFGAKKYSSHNWRRGLELSRLLGACARHLFAFIGGEDKDPETGLCHLDHASCCLMFARELWETHPHLDDRYKPETVVIGDNTNG